MHEVRSNSIIETSLTELAFIFFFILLTVSAWKINSIVDDVNNKEKENNKLLQKVDELSDSLKTASEIVNLGDKIKPDELFKELKLGREAVKELNKVRDEKDLLKEKVDSLAEVLDSKLSPEKLAEQINQNKKLKEILNEAGLPVDDPAEEVLKVLQKNNNIKGQNLNLRSKLAKIGNGLDHQPCWADPKTGKVQYVFEVDINEDSIEFKPSWPESRKDQAISNPNITRVPAVFSTIEEMQKQTIYLYNESKLQDCRHFVFMRNNTVSTKLWLKYSLAVESQFYKYVSRGQ